MIDVRYHRGLELPEHALWLDPWDDKPRAFVSHAHSDHIGNHGEIIASVGTARLMDARLPGERRQHLMEFGVPETFEQMRIMLLPAGHIFGSAQIHLETDAGSLLYTGDFKLRPGLSAEPATWQHAETLIMETTYGLPKYRMPPTEQVMAEMIEFCQEALDEGAVPVLLGYSLGKSQEILCALMKHGITPMLHGSVWRMTEIYRQLMPDFPTSGYFRYAPGQVAGKVLVCPPSAARSMMIQRIKNRRTAVLTGWALDPGAKFRYGCDAAFPLTDHADYPDLIRYVELVQPKRVLTLHGFAAAFARDLRERGIEAWALSQENQLELSLSTTLPAPFLPAPAPEPSDVVLPDDLPTPPPPTEPDSFLAFAETGERIAATTSKLKKIEILGAYLAGLSGRSDQSLSIAANYLTGRAFGQSDQRVLQTGWAVIMRALVAASKRPQHEVGAIARTHSDAGKTAYEVLLGATLDPKPFTLQNSRAFFDRLQAARGPNAKTELLKERLVSLDPLSASYLVRIVTGDFRIGLKEGLVEEAIASAFGAKLDEVREANMLLGNLGETALLASEKSLATAGVSLFRPVRVMLASPEQTAEALWKRLSGDAAIAETPAGHPFWVEDKYDGIRAQLHVGAGRVEIFTRDLKNVTLQFADLARTARTLEHQVILDGELLAYEAGRKLTFFDLQKRLGRKNEDDLFLGRSDIPVIYRAFDLLWIDGESLLRQPLAERRLKLEALPLAGGVEIAPIYRVHSAAGIDAAFDAARTRGNEGLIAKDGTSLYTPGRRGLAWLKLKKELATLDVVVVGAETGHGKRAGVLSDYTFAVRDENTGELLTIGKAYSGVTDEEIDELTERFLSSTLNVHGKYREVRPEVVLEIAFDSVQPSNRHSSGLALRFPRIKAVRRDKTPGEIDTLGFARSLVADRQTVSAPKR
jgi:DNA ligase-1